jgi:hypothetical protein
MVGLLNRPKDFGIANAIFQDIIELHSVALSV